MTVRLAENDTAAQAEARARVERGAAWLDAEAPGWESKVDVGRLVMNNCSRCIIGQVFGHFEEFLDRLSPDRVRRHWEAEEFGFDVDDHYPSDHGYVSYDLLTEAWTDLLKRRANQ